MKRIEKYFEKNGFVYGVSFKYAYQKCNHGIYRFENFGSALEWLHTEEYFFRERELMTESAAKRLVGAKVWREYKINQDRIFHYVIEYI